MKYFSLFILSIIFPVKLFAQTTNIVVLNKDENEKNAVENWMMKIAELQMKRKQTPNNNWEAKRCKIIGIAGCILNNEELKTCSIEHFKKYISTAYYADGTSRDLVQRDALHYHVSGLMPCISVFINLSHFDKRFDLFYYVSETGSSVKKSVEFAEAYRYYTKNKRNLLAEKPFPEVCYWIMYHTLPPGRLITFGDTNPNSRLSSPEIIAAAAAANNDKVLQGFYLRTSWNPVSTHCVVYGKSGRETNHDDNDVGQLCIDGFGEPLIVDPGKPMPIYPKDYFSKTQYNYYTRSVIGHNILCINNEEIKSEPNDQARRKIVKTWFNDSIGSYWEIDLSPVYENATKVSRKVAHLFPGIVVVHDYAEVSESANFELRWHCFAAPQLLPFGNGIFTTRNSKATLSARIISLNKNEPEFSSGHHEFKPPFHLSRLGDPLEQPYCPFVKISAKGKVFDTVTLFAVIQSNQEKPVWTDSSSGWELYYKKIRYSFSFENQGFKITSSEGKSIML